MALPPTYATVSSTTDASAKSARAGAVTAVTRPPSSDAVAPGTRPAKTRARLRPFCCVRSRSCRCRSSQISRDAITHIAAVVMTIAQATIMTSFAVIPTRFAIARSSVSGNGYDRNIDALFLVVTTIHGRRKYLAL
ncbi:hypothetical protein [Methylobacterium sp. Gmos1]